MSWAYRASPGLSPRGRGKQVNTLPAVARLRSIPAWAGETEGVKAGVDKFQVYPRVGGGNIRKPDTPLATMGLSPRGRGKPSLAL